GAFVATVADGLQRWRLRLERRAASLPGHRSRPRILATACWRFPIYSQTFVYQELTQLIRNGFAVRFLYASLGPRDHLPEPFLPLWRARRRIAFHPEVCRRAQASFVRRMPDR